MPIFAGMSAIPHTELARDTGITHRLEKLYITVQQKVIISAIHKPLYCTKLCLTRIICLNHIPDATMFLHRTRQHSHLVCGVGIFSHLLTLTGMFIKALMA